MHKTDREFNISIAHTQVPPVPFTVRQSGKNTLEPQCPTALRAEEEMVSLVALLVSKWEAVRVRTSWDAAHFI